MKAFTDTVIKKIKAKDKPFSLTEGDGFYIRVNPSGKLVWYHYFTIGKTRQWHKIGDYPLVGVAEARNINRKLKEQTDAGEDPALAPQGDLALKDLYNLWIERGMSPKNKPWSEAHQYNTRCMFNADILPKLGTVLVKNIRKQHIRQLLEAKERTAPNQALQLYRRLTRLFNYAAEQDIIESSPMANLKPIGRQGEKSRILSEEEIRRFLLALPHIDAAPNTIVALEVVLRTGQRPSEVCGMQTREIDGDWWIIPSERTKNGKEQRVYLSPTLKKILPEPNDKGMFFPALRMPEKGISHGVLSKAIRRSITGKEKRNDDSITLDIESFTPHDLRRTCATHLEKIGIDYNVIGAILNHSKDGVTKIYARHRFDEEKKKAWMSWERYLERLINNSNDSAKIINLFNSNT